MVDSKIRTCGNACTSNCIHIDKYFSCYCYQCIRTTLSINYCINCGNNKPSEILIFLLKNKDALIQTYM